MNREDVDSSCIASVGFSLTGLQSRLGRVKR